MIIINKNPSISVKVQQLFTSWSDKDIVINPIYHYHSIDSRNYFA